MAGTRWRAALGHARLCREGGPPGARGRDDMPIEVQCPHCGHVLAAPDAAAGRQGSCPNCKAPVQVPNVSAPAPVAHDPLAIEANSPPPEMRRYGQPEPDSGGAVGGAVDSNAGFQKECPDCAEMVKLEARICRYCRHEFEEDEDDEDDEDDEEEAPRRRRGRGKGSPSRHGAISRSGKTKARLGRSRGGAGSRTSKKAGGARRRAKSGAGNDPYAPSRASLKDGGRSRGKRGRGGVSKKRELATEGHIHAIGIWHALGGVFYGLIGMLFIFGSGSMGPALGPMANIAAGIGMVFLVLGAGSVFIGVGLTKRQGWARIAYAVVQGLLVLLQLPGLAQGGVNIVSTLLGIMYTFAILATLFGSGGSRVFARGYAASIQGDHRSVPWTGSPFFWIPAILTGLIILGLVAVFVLAGSM